MCVFQTTWIRTSPGLQIQRASSGPKRPCSPSSGSAASSSSCSSSSSLSSSLRCASGPGKTPTRSPAPPRCPSAPCPTPSCRGARLGRSPATSSFRCGQRTTTALTMRRWAATMATRSTSSRRCRRRAPPTSTTKSDALLRSRRRGQEIEREREKEKKREERLTYVRGKDTFLLHFRGTCFFKPVLFLAPAAQIWRTVHWPVTSGVRSWRMRDRGLFCLFGLPDNPHLLPSSSSPPLCLTSHLPYRSPSCVLTARRVGLRGGEAPTDGTQTSSFAVPLWGRDITYLSSPKSALHPIKHTTLAH